MSETQEFHSPDRVQYTSAADIIEAYVNRDTGGEIISRPRADQIFAPDIDNATGQLRPDAHEVTEKNRALAVNTLSQSLQYDAELNHIMGQYQQTHPDADNLLALVDAVHADAGLRVQLGQHFIVKISAIPPDELPNRVRSNKEKSPNYSHLHGLRPKLTSREYVSLLAVRMLDGSYDNSDDSTQVDGIVLNRQGTAIEYGQHRYTAKLLLGLNPQVLAQRPIG